MIIVLIHWRIKPDKTTDFLDVWRTQARVNDRTGLVAELLTEVKTPKDLWYITWHLDPDSLGDFVSYLNVGIWQDDAAFEQQIARYFNDSGPLRDFEKYRRRRVVLNPVAWRRGRADLPTADPAGVL